EGCVSIHRFVHKGHSLTLARDLRHFIELDKNNLDIEGIIELVYIVLQSVVKPGITGFFKIDLHIKCYIYLS
ncbi:MAG: hypothetical protein WA046_07490, partial [Blautia wexlerae]